MVVRRGGLSRGKSGHILRLLRVGHQVRPDVVEAKRVPWHPVQLEHHFDTGPARQAKQSV